MGRKVSETSGYKVSIHKTNGYCYASTQPMKLNAKTGKNTYSHVHWGVVDENLKFYPGKNYFYTDIEERSKLLFPQEWDLSELSRLYGQNQVNVKPNTVRVKTNEKKKANAFVAKEQLNYEDLEEIAPSKKVNKVKVEGYDDENDEDGMTFENKNNATFEKSI